MNDRVCQRCSRLCVDEPMSVASLSDPSGEVTARLCPDCSRMAKLTYFRSRPIPPHPLRNRLRPVEVTP